MYHIKHVESSSDDDTEEDESAEVLVPLLPHFALLSCMKNGKVLRWSAGFQCFCLRGPWHAQCSYMA